MARSTANVQFWTEHLSEAQYKVKDLARICGCTSRQLERDFKRILRCSPKAWMKQRRMERAQELLESGKSPKQLMTELRCPLAELCHLFKAHTRMTMREFKALHTALFEPAQHAMSHFDNKKCCDVAY